MHKLLAKIIGDIQRRRLSVLKFLNKLDPQGTGQASTGTLMDALAFLLARRLTTTEAKALILRFDPAITIWAITILAITIWAITIWAMTI